MLSLEEQQLKVLNKISFKTALKSRIFTDWVMTLSHSKLRMFIGNGCTVVSKNRGDLHNGLHGDQRVGLYRSI